MNPKEVAIDGEKQPRTARGVRTRRAILDAAAAEFSEHGYHDGSISGITRRAGVALGSFYTYFDSKDAVFRALVRDMSGQVRDYVTPRIAGAKVWMSELIGMVLSAVNVITAKLLRLPFRKALAEHPFGEQRTQVPAARFLHRPL
jgi:AcrR family transcriptional regulator